MRHPRNERVFSIRKQPPALSLPVFGEGGALLRAGWGQGMKFIQIRSQCRKDRFEHAIHVSIDIRISEAQYPIPHLIEHAIAPLIADAMAIETMLVAINFDDDAGAAAFEVDDIKRPIGD